jgi:hypothetical protein
MSGSYDARKESLNDLWYNLFLEGYPIGAEREQKLMFENYIPRNYQQKSTHVNRQNAFKNPRDYNVRSVKEVSADSMVEIIIGSDRRDTINTLQADDVADKVEELMNETQILTLEDELRYNNKNYSYYGKSGIKRKDWEFSKEEQLNYDITFWNWINSINSGFHNKINYHRFNLYQQQAYEWLSDTSFLFNPMADIEDQLKWLQLEQQRCLENSLYGMNKYLWLKEGEMEGGRIKYRAWESQEVTLYLFDLYVCMLIGKLRQIGETSTLGGAGIMRTMLRKSYFTKFISEKSDKGFEIFDDKVRFALTNFPEYIIPSINNDSAELFRFLRKDGKGKQGGADSKFAVEAPYPTAINGGTPNLVLLDEIATIPFFSEMVDNGRVTLFWINPQTGRPELKRQCVAWGTGGKQKIKKGNVASHGAAMMQEFNAIQEAWMDKDFASSIFIPLFLSWQAKPGLTKEFVEQQRRYYYSKNNEESKIIFHQTYPETIEEMFLLSSKTLVPISKINEHINRINLKKDKVKFGYFTPIFDKTKPNTEEEPDVPYAIIGSEFVLTSGLEDDLTTACIIEEPEESQHRYFQGVDPIQSVSGHSKMASTIRDKLKKKPVSQVFFRTRVDEDHRGCYRQVLLQALYYDKKMETLKINVEINQGQPFVDYVKSKGFKKALLRNFKLPEMLHSGTAEFGYRKMPSNQRFLVSGLKDMLLLHGDNIDDIWFWMQCKTYVEKTTTDGYVKYQANNLSIDYDDDIDSQIASYFCEKSSTVEPVVQANQTLTNKYVWKLVYENGRCINKRVKI